MIIDFVIKNKILSLILLLAILFRFIGVSPGFHPYHSDEGMSYSSAIEMIRNLNIDPGRYDYPSLIPLIHAVAYIFLFIPIFIIKSLIFSPEDLPTKGQNLIELWQQVVFQKQQTHVLFWGRYITAFFGVLVVFMVYKLGAKLFADRRIGLVAAFLTAVNFRQVLNSHLGLPDIYNAFFLLLAIFFFSVLLEKPGTKNYLFSGISVGLFFSTKLQSFALPTFILTHVFIFLKTNSFIVWGKTANKTFRNLLTCFLDRKFLVGLLIIPIVILLINPYHWIKLEEFIGEESYNLLKYRLGTNMLNIFPISYLYHIGLGREISLFVIFGAFLSLLKYPRSTLVLLSVVLPFLYFFFYYSGGGYYTRNFVTITPLLLVFAGILIVAIWNMFSRRFKNQLVVKLGIVVTLVVLSLTNIKNSFINSYYFSRPWGFEEAHNWAKINIPEGATIVSHPWDKYPRDKNLKIIPFEISTVFSLAEMQEEGAEFGFINMDWLTLPSYWWMNRTTKESLEFWDKPDALLSNTYHAVVAQELASFSVVKFVKPWQAPDMNFLIVKIPQVPTIEKKKQIADFNFDSQDSLTEWNLIDGDRGAPLGILLDTKIGRTTNGSLKFETGSRKFPIIRAVSPPVAVQEKKAIIVEGWIKTADSLGKNRRDGYLRVDFYKDNPKEVGLETPSLYVSVSARGFGNGGWAKRGVTVIPPDAARFMTVSAQINGNTTFWFDDIKIYQSEEQFKNPRTQPPYLDYRIPEDILFPYSQGGM